MPRTMSLESIRAEQTPATMTYFLSCFEIIYLQKKGKIGNYTKQKSFLRGTNQIEIGISISLLQNRP